MAEAAAETDIAGMGTHKEIMFKVVGVKRYYPVTTGVLKRHVSDVKAVDGVDFEIRRGQTRGLVGESGCGKTTLARLLAKLDKPTDGHIYFNLTHEEAAEIDDLEALGEERSSDEDERLAELRRRYEINTMTGDRADWFRKNVQIVFQNPSSSLNPKRFVRNIVTQPLREHENLSAAELEDRAIALLEEVGIGDEFLYRYPHSLSGGQKQRVAIARAIALNPECIVLDEPTSALDVSVQAKILNLLEDLQENFDLTYLFITHDLGVIRHVADHISVMYLGDIVEEASRSALFEAPKHPYTEALISSSPALDVDDRIRLEGDVPDPEHPPTGCTFHTRCHKAEAFCGWSGRDIEALLEFESGRVDLAERMLEAIVKADHDGYESTFVFDDTVDSDEAHRVLAGEIEAIRAAKPALFEAIEDVRTDGEQLVVSFRETPVPRRLGGDSGHIVTCHLYDDTVG